MASGKIKTLVLLDAHAIIHRAYHALPEFVSRQGEPTGGLYGLSTMLLKLVADLKPDYLIACYDLPEPTFRKQAFADYKAGRKEADPALVSQLKRSRDIFTAFGIPIYDCPGFEADDIIGTIVAQTKNIKNLKIIIASGDMDTLQLVSGKKITVYTFKKGIKDTIIYDESGVIERFGFKPALLPDFKGLRGDPSDNIPGIAGIGEKTASLLVGQFGSLDNIYKKLEKDKPALIKAGVKQGVIDKLLTGKDEAYFSKSLGLIRLDAPINFSLSDKEWSLSLHQSTIERIFSDLDFRSLANRLPGKPEVNPVVDNYDSRAVKELLVGLWLLDSTKTDPTLDDVFFYTGTKDLTKAEQIIKTELKTKKLETVYRRIELPLIDILETAKNRGLLVDRSYFKKLSNNYHKKLTALETEIHSLAGKKFNINSPKQLAQILFDDLSLGTKGLKKTAGGARSTKESELEKLKDKHPIIKQLLSYRELQKLLSTYVDNIPQMVDNESRLHSSLIQTGTVTGRMSSKNPNLQNIPIRDGLGVAVRRGFVATPGFKWLAADYSQIEMRILAEISGDLSLISMFTAGQDIHTGVAAKVFSVTEGEVTKEMRRRAKVINFGIIYGMGINALKANLNSSKAEAEQFYDQYFAAFPTIKKYLDSISQTARQKGYTETIFGRRRYLGELKSPIPYIKAAAERQAVNAPIQGTAADMVKLAMIDIDKKLSGQAQLLLQVHDELIYEAKEDKAKEIGLAIKEIMEHITKLKVPLVVNLSIGPNWGELKEIV